MPARRRQVAQAGDVPEQGGFARGNRPDQRGDAAGRERQFRQVQDFLVAVADAQVADLEAAALRRFACGGDASHRLRTAP